MNYENSRMRKAVIVPFLFLTFGLGAKSASLIEIYQLATINDPFIKEALANKEAIIESKPQARSLILPQLSSSAIFQTVMSMVKARFNKNSSIQSREMKQY